MDKKFACYTPSPYFDFRECKMHDNSCNPNCDNMSPCNNFCPHCNKPNPPPKPSGNCNNFCCVSPCLFWFASGVVFSNFIRK